MAEYPMFELAGPPCKQPECKGALIPVYDLRTRECSSTCSECKTRYNVMPAKDVVPSLVATLKRVLKSDET